MIKVGIVSLSVRVIASIRREFPPGEAPISMPERFQVFNSFEEIPKFIKDEIARSYVIIFKEWGEKWSEDVVLENLKNEMSKYPSCLTIMPGNDELPIGGFCWFAVIPTDQITQRIIAHVTLENKQITQLQSEIKGSRILFVDEIAVAKQFRIDTMEALQFLFRPMFEVALSERLEIIGWTVPKANIHPLLLKLGFKELATTDDMLFLYASRSIAKALAKLDQNLRFESVQKIISWMSRLIRAKK